MTLWGFPHSSVGKESAYNAGDIRDVGSVPGLRRSPGGGHGNPLQYSCLENAMDRGAWLATVCGVTRVGPGLVTNPPAHDSPGKSTPTQAQSKLTCPWHWRKDSRWKSRPRYLKSGPPKFTSWLCPPVGLMQIKGVTFLIPGFLECDEIICIS